MSDSKMFTSNEMPEGYDEVWKRFGEHWCGETEEPKKIWIGKHGKPLSTYKSMPRTAQPPRWKTLKYSEMNRNDKYLYRLNVLTPQGIKYDYKVNMYVNAEGKKGMINEEGKFVS